MDYQNVVEKIKYCLTANFPGLVLEIRDNIEGVFVVINDKKLFFSEEYALACLEIEKELLWPNNIHNIEFTFDESLTTNLILLNDYHIAKRVSVEYETRLQCLQYECRFDNSQENLAWAA